MGKATAQGTAWETEIRKRAEQAGRQARRTAKAGQRDEADVIIEGRHMRPAVAWKWYRKTGGKKRSALRMVVLLEEDYWRLVEKDTDHEIGWLIQAKARERLSVAATLEGVLSWAREQGML